MLIRTLLIFCATLFLSSACFAEKIIKSHALSMYGQSKYPANFDRFEYTSPDAIEGGTLKIAEIGTFDSFNFFALKGTYEANSGLLLHDTLMDDSFDEPSGRYGLIAESIEYPESREWIIFHLNPKATFNDGHPVTAEDVVFSFNSLIEKAGPRYKLYWGDVAKVEAISPHAVKFTSKNTQNQELFLILGQIPVLAKHYWEKNDISQSSLNIPVVSGPYTIEKFDAGRSVTYIKNKNYWANSLPTRKGMFNFKRIRAEYYKDINVMFEAFKAGEFDLYLEPTAKNWATGYDIPQVKAGTIIKQEIPDDNSKGMTGLVFNQRKNYLKSPALRQAIGLAFDFEWTNKNIFYGAYKRTDSYFENSELASTGLPSKEELAILNKYKDKIPASVFTEEFKPPVTDGSGNNRNNLKKAKDILQKAGFKIQSGKLLHQNNQEVSFEIIQASSVYEPILNPWIENLKRLGIKTTLRILDRTQFINKIQSFDYDATVITLPQSLSPGNEQRYYWGSKDINAEGSQNYMGISNPAIDEIIEKVINVTSREEQITATRALDRILLHSHYAIPLYHSNTFRVATWNKFSKPKIAPKYDYIFTYGPHFWWFDKEKSDKLKKQ